MIPSWQPLYDLYAILIGAAAIALTYLVAYFPLFLWLKARSAGVSIGVWNLMRLRMMGVPPAPIVDYLIIATEAGIPVTLDQLTTLHLAGGHIDAVIQRLIRAKREHDPLTWNEAVVIDLSGWDGRKGPKPIA
jgi:uncharacterized protein YqfA (UPF0365 family)